MAECVLAKNGWITVGGYTHHYCHEKKNQCNACKRIVCANHRNTIKFCKDCKKHCYIHPTTCKHILCDECIVYNVQYTFDREPVPIQDYVYPETLSNMLQCYPGVLTKPCKK